MSDVREIATGLRFPEGPIAMPDGSVILVEIAAGALTRVDTSTGEIDVVADCGGGPNGAAVGPDGKVYVCNNGGFFRWHEMDGGGLVPLGTPDTWHGGCIQRVDVDTGEVETLYDSCDGKGLVAPNDLVFDDHGGMWFTDHGVRHVGAAGGEHDEYADRPGLLYAKADGSSIVGAAYGTDATNGVGLSPAGDRVYAAETHGGQVWEWAVSAPGEIGALDEGSSRSGGRLLFDAPQGHLFDSLAVDGDGWVCVATIGPGGITAIAPDGSASELIDAPPDFLVTNICFGGGGDLRTAFITCSTAGKLVSLTWPRPGLRLAY